MNKLKVLSKNYGFAAMESFKKYVPNSDSTQEDIREICLQYLLKGYTIEPPHAYWAWLHYCDSLRSPWLPVNSSFDIPTLLAKFVTIERV